MKKFLIYCLVAMMLVASVSVVASAAASDWTKGNGFHVYEPADPANPKSTSGRSDETRIETNSPVTTADGTGDYGVYVEHRGYYESGDNWGGVVSKDMFGLDGLEVTVKFDEVPVVDGADDCWIALDLVAEERSFRTNDPYNPGLIDLVRFGRPEIEFYGAKGWGGTGKSGINGSDFAVKSGDTLKLSVRYELGQYIVTFSHNDTATFEVPADLTLQASDEVWTEGKARVLVMASCFGVDKNFKYNVSVKNGAPLTAEQIASKDFEKSKNESYNAAEECVDEIKDYQEEALELAGDSTDETVLGYVDTINAALDTASAATESVLAATTIEEAEAAAQTALEAKNEASTALKALDQYIADFGSEEDTDADTDEDSDEVVDEAEDKATSGTSKKADSEGIPVFVWFIVAGVLVVVVVVVIVLGKKK